MKPETARAIVTVDEFARLCDANPVLKQAYIAARHSWLRAYRANNPTALERAEQAFENVLNLAVADRGAPYTPEQIDALRTLRSATRHRPPERPHELERPFYARLVRRGDPERIYQAQRIGTIEGVVRRHEATRERAEAVLGALEAECAELGLERGSPDFWREAERRLRGNG